MNASKKTIAAARAKSMMSATLRKACNLMFVDKRHSPYPEAENLSEWLEEEFNFLALMIGDARNVTVNNLICALRVEMLGDKFSSVLAQNARRNGWDSVSVSYVEDGRVFCDLYVSGKSAEENKEEACARGYRKKNKKKKDGLFGPSDSRPCPCRVRRESQDTGTHIKKGGNPNEVTDVSAHSGRACLPTSLWAGGEPALVMSARTERQNLVRLTYGHKMRFPDRYIP